MYCSPPRPPSATSSEASLGHHSFVHTREFHTWAASWEVQASCGAAWRLQWPCADFWRPPSSQLQLQPSALRNWHTCFARHMSAGTIADASWSLTCREHSHSRYLEQRQQQQTNKNTLTDKLEQICHHWPPCRHLSLQPFKSLPNLSLSLISLSIPETSTLQIPHNSVRALFESPHPANTPSHKQSDLPTRLVKHIDIGWESQLDLRLARWKVIWLVRRQLPNTLLWLSWGVESHIWLKCWLRTKCKVFAICLWITCKWRYMHWYTTLAI